MKFLLDNIRQQQTAIRQMNKTPTRLLCDPASFDVLMDEVGPSLTPMVDPASETRIFGLVIEFTDHPNFEVV